MKATSAFQSLMAIGITEYNHFSGKRIKENYDKLKTLHSFVHNRRKKRTSTNTTSVDSIIYLTTAT